jgi:hypothetical protein
MHLGEYLNYHDIPVQQFVSEIGAHRTAVYRYIKGLMFPRKATLRLIVELTNGKVTANDMTDHYNYQQDCWNAIKEDEQRANSGE